MHPAREPPSPFLVTGVGSLPHADPAAAVSFVAAHAPEAPFWPQLPRRSPSEGMVGQALAGALALLEPIEPEKGRRFGLQPSRRRDFIARLLGSPGCLNEDEAAGFAAFVDAVARERFPRAVVLKGQIVGPHTLFAALDLGDAPRRDPELLRALAARVERIARWQIERLAVFGLPVQLWLDEPVLPPDADQVLWPLVQSLSRHGARIGIHCCARPLLAPIARIDPALLSFDADRGLETLAADPGMIAFARTHALALGLVPTDRPFAEDDVARTVRRLAGSGLDRPGDRGPWFITASCGLGLTDEVRAARSFAAAAELCRRIAAPAETR